MAEQEVRDHVERILARAEARQQRRDARRLELMAGPLDAAAGGGLLGAGAGERLLVAEGDSWFDFPGTDVLEELEEVFGYEVVSVAHRGDTLEDMAYGAKQLDGLNRKLKKLADRGQRPLAILLSAGGNDIAGDELTVLLNHAKSGLDVLNEDIVRGVLDVRLRSAFVELILTIAELAERHFGQRDIPVLVHGYAHPVPDGRGFWGGWGPLPGPWLRPGFFVKGHMDLVANSRAMARLIDRFYDMLDTLPGESGLQHVRTVNLRDTLVSDPTADYKKWWSDELHPEEEGFEKVAERLHEVLLGLG